MDVALQVKDCAATRPYHARVHSEAESIVSLASGPPSLEADPRVLALAVTAIPLIVLRSDGCVASCNHAAAARFARRRDEIEGRDWHEIVAHDELDPGAFSVERLFDAEGCLAGSIVTLASTADEVSELRLAIRRKDEFLAVLAHELRNPLAPLRNGLHLARAVGIGDSALKPLLAMMDRQIGVLARLVDDLLDVSRVSSGKLQLASEPLSLQEVLSDSCDLVRDRFARTSHTLDLRLAPLPCTVLGDRDRLQQVFVNLLSNAAKYSDAGSEVIVDLTFVGEFANVAVEDKGVGLELEDTQEIFNMYSQVRLHEARAQGGLGIGLALVKRLVELHGGSVEASSDGPGTGSRFCVRLPLSPA